MFFVMEHDMMLFATTESVKRISSLDMGTIMVKWLVANICILNILLEMCWYLKIQETNIVIDYNIIFQRLFYDVVAPPPPYMKRHLDSGRYINVKSNELLFCSMFTFSGKSVTKRTFTKEELETRYTVHWKLTLVVL